jgi:polyisoprenoid-binding protein YceI
MSLDQLTAGIWNIDQSHSSVAFIARHLMVTKVRGRFDAFEGTVTIGDDQLASAVTATVQTGSFSTGDQDRDGHVKSGDFLDVENFPTMSFASTSVATDGSDYKLVGDLTIKGITKSVTFELEYDGVSPDPWGGTRAGFSAETEINRKDFGIEWNAVLETGGVMLGEKVKIVLDIQAVRA